MDQIAERLGQTGRHAHRQRIQRAARYIKALTREQIAVGFYRQRIRQLDAERHAAAVGGGLEPPSIATA
jgi:hypothetical protein